MPRVHLKSGDELLETRTFDTKEEAETWVIKKMAVWMRPRDKVARTRQGTATRLTVTTYDGVATAFHALLED